MVTAAFKGGWAYRPIPSYPEEKGGVKVLPDENANRPLPDKHIIKLNPIYTPLPTPTTTVTEAVTYLLQTEAAKSVPQDFAVKVFKLMYPGLKPDYGTDTPLAQQISQELAEINVEVERQIEQGINQEALPPPEPVDQLVALASKAIRPFDWPELFSNPELKRVMLAFDPGTRLFSAGPDWFSKVLTPWLNSRWDANLRTERVVQISSGTWKGADIFSIIAGSAQAIKAIRIKGFGFQIDYALFSANNLRATIKIDYDDPRFEKVVAEMFSAPFVAVRGEIGLQPINAIEQTPQVKKFREEMYKFIKKYVVQMVDARAFTPEYAGYPTNWTIDYDPRDLNWDAVNSYAATKFR